MTRDDGHTADCLARHPDGRCGELGHGWGLLYGPDGRRTERPREEWEMKLDEAERDGRWRLLGSAALLLLMALPAAAQTPAPSPSPWAVQLETGGGTLSTRESSEAFLAARLTLAGPLGDKARGWLRADLDRSQDGGVLSINTLTSLQDQFRSLEVGVGARYYVAQGLSVGAVGGVTYSAETDFEPRDPRLWTGLGCVLADVSGRGYAGACGGWRGPVGGYAFTVTASLPVGSDAATAIDFDLPLQSLDGRPRAWTVKVRALLKVFKREFPR